MDVAFTPDQHAFVQKAIESGRFRRDEEAVQEALALWEKRERRRLEIVAMIDEEDASLARAEDGCSRKNRHQRSSMKSSSEVATAWLLNAPNPIDGAASAAGCILLRGIA
jgi:Arc/MetJ-type ribon-helix-helix transcriptional regulator